MTKKEILPAVSAVIFNGRGEVLLQKRKDTGRWCVISGHVEFGETIEEAIVREIMEEIGVPCKVKRLIGVYSSPEFTTYHYTNRIVQYVVTYFEVDLLGAVQDGLTNEETLEIAYFHPDNLPYNLDLVNPHWLADALNTQQHAFIR